MVSFSLTAMPGSLLRLIALLAFVGYSSAAPSITTNSNGRAGVTAALTDLQLDAFSVDRNNVNLMGEGDQLQGYHPFQNFESERTIKRDCDGFFCNFFDEITPDGVDHRTKNAQKKAKERAKKRKEEDAKEAAEEAAEEAGEAAEDATKEAGEAAENAGEEAADATAEAGEDSADAAEDSADQ